MRAVLLLVVVLPMLLAAETGGPRIIDVRRFHLKLHAPNQSGLYFTAWADGDVVSDHDGSDGKTVVYRRRLVWYDGCTWEASETLTPRSADRYDYRYREAVVSCPKGSAPNAVTTPMDGEVSVHPATDNRPLTALFAWAKGWEHTAP